jgi:hypothetical protein
MTFSQLVSEVISVLEQEEGLDFFSEAYLSHKSESIIAEKAEAS